MGSHSFPCAIGRGGIRTSKLEGDGATPAGEFELRRILYRADRIPYPDTALEVTPIGPRDGWCDAPGHPEYNCQVRLPINASAERLRRADPVYDIIVVLGHNDAPIIDGMGSAIFMHIANPNFAPTAGCVALRRKDLLAVLHHCGPDSRLVVHQPG
jgi:L,D-peptidoglycan transpeptidase YkuD (ErfK/YbiS/YcfS/YnhG family)